MMEIEFESSHKDIYPPDLQLEKENIAYSEEPFIDLGIKNDHKSFNIQLYGTRDDFPFSTVRMPHFISDSPIRIF